MRNLSRFNRYMVECECRCERDARKGVIVLIDTWWNVNKQVRFVEKTYTVF